MLLWRCFFNSVVMLLLFMVLLLFVVLLLFMVLLLFVVLLLFRCSRGPPK
jgi:hypothetical protein